MNTNTGKCPVCGGEEMKYGKLHGVACVQPMDARTNLGGSELIAAFCALCGEVVSWKVKDPEKVK